MKAEPYFMVFRNEDLKLFSLTGPHYSWEEEDRATNVTAKLQIEGKNITASNTAATDTNKESIMKEFIGYGYASNENTKW